MKLATLICCTALLGAGPLLAQQTQPDSAALDNQLRAAQLDVQLANARLALVQTQAELQAGNPALARANLSNAQQLLAALSRQTDITAYKQVVDRLARDVDRAEDAQRRLARTPPPVPVPAPDGVAVAPPVAPAPAPACTEDANCSCARERGPCSCRLCPPIDMPNLDEQSAIAVDQARLAKESGYTNVPGSRIEMMQDPAVVKQRTLDHQTRWDMGRYAPARELIDVGMMLELDMERIHYQGTLYAIRNGARIDELLHVIEAEIPPPGIMNYPDDWKCIEEARAKYADGKLWESEPFKDADGKTKTVAVYDVADLLFVPIFPGPSEYNVTRPIDPVRYWAHQERRSEWLTHPEFSWYDGYGGYPYYYGGAVPPPVVVPNGGPAVAPNGAVNGSYYGPGGYYGYRVTDVIGSASYYPFEADPIYQYRLAQKRATLLGAVSQMMAATRE
jgi:hypothetical protein